MRGKVIFTTYYTGKPNPQKTARKAIPSDYGMIKGFYESVNRLGLQAFVFHDRLTDEFVKKYSRPNFQFIWVPYYSQRSLNDERFYVYRRVLDENPEVEWLLTTDLFDVVFNKNPFEFMREEDKIYVGSETRDVANFAVIKNKAHQVYQDAPKWWGMIEEKLLNAGIVGGHRTIMRRLLQLMVNEFESIDKTVSSNMFVLSKCILTNSIRYVTGPPFHSGYKKYEEGGEHYILHK